MGINTCYQCKDRFVGCHSSCERYINAKKLHDEEQSKFRSEKQMNDYVHSKKPKKTFVRPKALNHYINGKRN